MMSESQKSSQFQALSLEAALESFMDGVVIIDASLQVTYSNRAARRICRKTDLPGDRNWSRHFGIFYSDDEKLCPTKELPILRALRGTEVHDELLYLKNEKMERGHFVSCSARPVFEGSTIVGAIMSFRVMTEALEKERAFEAERRKMESSFQMAALGSTLAELGHEIKNPLTAISSATWLLGHMLEKSPLPTQSMREQLDCIQGMVERVDEIIKSVRNASRNSLQDSATLHDFNEVLSDALNVCSFKLKGIKVEAPTPGPATILCSRVQFCQVLVNLLSNAADAVEASPSRWIRIEFEETEALTIVRVSDSGTGIPEALEEKAFSAFFTTKEFGKGTGLGLSLSRTYIENLSGKLQINRAVSASCFEITIPRPTQKSEAA